MSGQSYIPGHPEDVFPAFEFPGFGNCQIEQQREPEASLISKLRSRRAAGESIRVEP